MSNDYSVINPKSKLGVQMIRAVENQRMIFVAGLPSAGKSLVFQQLTILADKSGRKIHSIQWDSARQAFETKEWLTQFPEIDNLTHPGVRKAVGLWARAGVARWHEQFPEPENILIGELPVVGGRLIELARPEADAIEKMLASKKSVFLIPIPSEEVRHAIEDIRSQTISNPRHEKEANDAPLAIVQNDWLATRHLYNAWQGQQNNPSVDVVYDTEVYRSVFRQLMRYRQLQFLEIEELFDTQGSVYERTVPVSELQATKEDVASAYQRLNELFPGNLAERATDEWANY